MTHYKHRYRIESARLPGWDYTATGYYFVTICTRRRQHFFGTVINSAMCLSPIGELVQDEWLQTEHVRQYVSLDEWIIMPNHMHGIIVINEPAAHTDDDDNDVDDGNGNVETPRRGVSTAGGTSQPSPTSPQPPRIRSRDDVAMPMLQSQSLGAIVGQFKSVATKRIRAAGYHDFAWQTRFYDVIIHDAQALDNIRRYIQNNPRRWHLDRHNAEYLFM
ncbi:MAG TPA: transposase [Roseiflexaceae bacterium]|nr:transposase [Roseiflexaceae bacterium]